MYDSGVMVSDIISMLESEVDIRGTLDYNSISRWISSLEQLIYTDLVKCYRSCDVGFDGTSFNISDMPKNDGERSVIFDDIVKVYDETDEVIRSGAIAAWQFREDKAIYWQDGETVQVRLLREGVDTLHVIYRVRPEIKVGDSDDTVKVPYEWLEMVLSKVRGEAYKIAGDDAQAAKWLGDYNTQLEQFKAWVAERQKWFGE